MAKSNKQAAPAAGAEKAPVKRNLAADILVDGSKGKLIKNIALLAIGLHCAEHVKGMPAEKAKEARKTENNKLAPKWSNKTLSRLALSGQGEDYNKLLSLAKGAGADIAASNYSAKVKAFIEFMKNYGGTGTHGVKDRSKAADWANQL